MSCLSEHHKVLTDGVGKCSVPMWSADGCPAGFCDGPAYGMPEPHQDRYGGYSSGLVCFEHGGPRLPMLRHRPTAAEELDR